MSLTPIEERISVSSVPGSQQLGKDEVMKKESENEMLEEYDFSKGSRGKYAKRYHQSSNIIVLEPDVSRRFPNSGAVNQALRTLTALGKAGK